MKNKQKTIGINPLDFYLSYNDESKTDNSEENKKNDLKECLDAKNKEQVIQTSEDGNNKSELVKLVNTKEAVTETYQERAEVRSEASVQETLNKHIDLQELEEVKVQKERVTIHVPAQLIDKVKNVVYWEPGLTLAAFAEVALQRLLDDLEKERGEPFPPRKRHRLFGGRPLK